MQRPFEKILIVGAGPAGLLLALLLAQHGIPVRVLEASHELDQRPRAAHYGPPAIPDLARAGVVDEVRRRGLTLSGMSWRRLDGRHGRVAGFDARAVADVGGRDLRTACLPMQELDGLMLDRLVRRFGGEVSWRHRVVALGEEGARAWVDVETPRGGERVWADYVVGCDGANSTVRKCLFGDEFPGFTWEEQIVATNTYYDFAGKYGFDDANFIIDPEHFFMAARITPDGLYRITYGEKPGLDLEQLKARQPWKFETMLPGHPRPGEYRLVNLAPYRMHQRCAPAFRRGRFLLVADAAHLCNPWGGLGITGGFVDAGGLYDCLAGMWDGLADDGILDLYSEKRRDKWRTVIDPVSQENFRRVMDKDPATRLQRDEWLQLLKSVEGDLESTRDLLLRAMEVRYDFTQHYKTKGGHNDKEKSMTEGEKSRL